MSTANQPTGNTATLLKDIAQWSNTPAINVLSDLVGTIADWAGAVGAIVSIGEQIVQWLDSGQQTSTDQLLQNINAEIQNVYTQLNKTQEAKDILTKNTTLNDDISDARSALQGLKAEINAQPPPYEVVDYITPILTDLNKLAGPAQPDYVWGITAGWPTYWTDIGQYRALQCIYVNCAEQAGEAGYGPQIPDPNPDGVTVFSYVDSLPIYLYAVAALLAVAGSLDPNFGANYADALRAAACGWRIPQVP